MFKKSQRKQIQFRAFLWQPNVLEPEARSRLLDEAKLQSTLHLAQVSKQTHKLIKARGRFGVSAVYFDR